MEITPEQVCCQMPLLKETLDKICTMNESGGPSLSHKNLSCQFVQDIKSGQNVTFWKILKQSLLPCVKTRLEQQFAQRRKLVGIIVTHHQCHATYPVFMADLTNKGLASKHSMS